MKNDARKQLHVILLDAEGKPETGAFAGPEPIVEQGRYGFRVRDRMRVYAWPDEGKTWKRAEKAK